MNNCPCGSEIDYAACCEPIITGSQPAVTAEQLMRARYSAHVKVEVDFIYESIHPHHRTAYDHKGTKEWAEKADWQGLEIVETKDGDLKDDTGEVQFIASFKDKGSLRRHHERGHFERKDGKWYFTEGEMVKSAPITVNKVGRNDPCPCGSGKKYKKCCA